MSALPHAIVFRVASFLNFIFSSTIFWHCGLKTTPSNLRFVTQFNFTSEHILSFEKAFLPIHIAWHFDILGLSPEYFANQPSSPKTAQAFLWPVKKESRVIGVLYYFNSTLIDLYNSNVIIMPDLTSQNFCFNNKEVAWYGISLSTASFQSYVMFW